MGTINAESWKRAAREKLAVAGFPFLVDTTNIIDRHSAVAGMVGQMSWQSLFCHLENFAIMANLFLVRGHVGFAPQEV